MDLQRLQALGAEAVTLTAANPAADLNILKAPKYQESGAVTPNAKTDDESQWEVLAYHFSGDTAGKWYFENAAGTDVGMRHYYAANFTSQTIECMLEFGKGKPILLGGQPTGNFSLTIYVVDRNYKNRFRLPKNT